MSFINHNGKYFNSKDTVITAENRAFNYGDSIFETMQMSGGEIMFWDDHFNRLQGALDTWRLKLADNIDKDELKKSILALAQKNNCATSARVKVNVYRNGEGRYTPEENLASYVIKAYPREKPELSDFIDNFTVTLFEGIPKPIHPTSNYKTGSSMTYIMAGLYAKDNGFDDALITNTNGHIVDAVYSSAFIVKDGVVKTSPVEIGCIDGIMRKQVIKVCEEMNIPVEITPVSVSAVENADELFVTNAVQLLKSAKSYNGIELGSVIGKQIYEVLLRKFFVS